MERYARARKSFRTNPFGKEVTLLAPFVKLQVASLRRTQGQGTVEYVALITLVALVMVGVIAALKSAQFAEGQELGAMILKKITEAVSKVKY